MEVGNQILLVILIITILSAVGFQLIRKKMIEPKRTNIVQHVANKHGWQFKERVDKAFVQQFDFPYFTTDSIPRTVQNVIQGEQDGMRFIAFDYYSRRRAHGGYRREGQRESVIILDAPTLKLPTFALAHRNVLEPPVKQYETYIKSSYINVQGVSEPAIRSTFTDSVLAQLPSGLNFQGNGQRLICYRTWKQANPDAIPAQINQCIKFAKVLM